MFTGGKSLALLLSSQFKLTTKLSQVLYQFRPSLADAFSFFVSSIKLGLATNDALVKFSLSFV
jgi:hypothetical protein